MKDKMFFNSGNGELRPCRVYYKSLYMNFELAFSSLEKAKDRADELNRPVFYNGRVVYEAHSRSLQAKG